MSDERTVTVVGMGTSTAAPDQLLVVLAAEVTADAPMAALNECAATLAGMRTAALDVAADARLQTSQLSVTPEWSGQQRQRIAGYTANTILTVRLDDPSVLGALLSATVEHGGSSARVYRVGWELRDRDGAAAEARAAAFRDARNRAEQYALLAGRTLGAVVRVDERDSVGGGWHRSRHVAFAASPANFEADPGEVDVVASVLVTWELR